MFEKAEVGDLENTIPIWIFDHLGKRSYMTTEVTQYLSSPKEDPPNNERSSLVENQGSLSVDIRPPLERETNIMT